MLTYDVDGRVLSIVAAGTPSDDERRRLIETVEHDPRVQDASLVLLDVRRADKRGNPREVEHRTRYFIQRLGRKIGPVCAVIVAAGVVLFGGRLLVTLLDRAVVGEQDENPAEEPAR